MAEAKSFLVREEVSCNGSDGANGRIVGDVAGIAGLGQRMDSEEKEKCTSVLGGIYNMAIGPITL